MQEDKVIDKALCIGTQPESETAGHRHLQVRVAWHKNIFVAFALLLQLCKEAADILCHEAKLLADEEFQIDQHLVVAAASRMYLLADVAQAACEHQFHLRMHILHAFLNDELSFSYLRQDIA